MAESNFFYISNLPALDFVNTEPILRGEKLDLLGSYDDLLSWFEAAELPVPDTARRVWGAERDAVHRQAIRLRATLRDAAERLARGKGVGEETVKIVNRTLASRPVFAQLRSEGKRYRTHLEPVTREPLHLLFPVAESAAWLLEHGDRSLVRKCENPECVLFFYDTTKNRKRRWCSMDACGSRAKALAYYRRRTGGKVRGER
jgi:predicted RNA-binding Zn ribbon-like protein